MKQVLAVKVDQECDNFISLTQGLAFLDSTIKEIEKGMLPSEKEWNEEIYLRMEKLLKEVRDLDS